MELEQIKAVESHSASHDVLQLCFVWQSNLIARVLVILLLNKIVQEQFSEYDEFTALGLSAVHLKD